MCVCVSSVQWYFFVNAWCVCHVKYCVLLHCKIKLTRILVLIFYADDGLTFIPKISRYEGKTSLARKDGQDVRKSQKSVRGRCGSMSSKGDRANVNGML